MKKCHGKIADETKDAEKEVTKQLATMRKKATKKASETVKKAA